MKCAWCGLSVTLEDAWEMTHDCKLSPTELLHKAGDCVAEYYNSRGLELVESKGKM